MTTNFLNETGTTATTAAKPATTPNWLSTTLDTIKFGVSTWTDAQKRQAEADTAAAALKLEALKLQELQTQGQIASTSTDAKSSLIKSYGTPILITGLVVALGIGTYFYFKKKS